LNFCHHILRSRFTFPLTDLHYKIFVNQFKANGYFIF
jgi:hypothetical protein